MVSLRQNSDQISFEGSDPEIFFTQWKALLNEGANYGVIQAMFNLSDLTSILFLKAIDSRFNTVFSIILNSEALSSIDEMYSKIMLDYQRQDTKSTIEIHAAFTRVVDGKQTQVYLVIHQMILLIAGTSHAQLKHRRLEHSGTTVTLRI